ncbi:MAG TPA: hypothetical protein VMI56_03315 [Reyranella sp.]|nr:hypothetical protein [Reyranella sp.]
MGLFSWLFGPKEPKAEPVDEIRQMIMAASRRAAAAPPALPPELKPYVTRLRAVFARVGSFAAGETPEIGREIYAAHGHDGMVKVCDAIRAQLGGGPARDLEYKWNGVGEWRG